MTSRSRQASQTKSTSEQLRDLTATHAASKAHRVRALQNEIHEALGNQVPLVKIVELLRRNEIEVRPEYLKKILYRAKKKTTNPTGKDAASGNREPTENKQPSAAQLSQVEHTKPAAPNLEVTQSSSCNPTPTAPAELSPSDSLASTSQRSIADIRSEAIDMSELRRAGRKYRMAHEGKASK